MTSVVDVQTAPLPTDDELEQMVYGVTTPRLWTRPLRELTEDTSLGFECIRFAHNIVGVELLPWQEWWLIHALEVKANGEFRFRTILTLISRQNGKTFLLKILALYFLYVLRAPLVLGVAQKLDIAHESWDATYEMMIEIPALSRELAPPARRGLKPGRRDSNGSEEIQLSRQVDESTKKQTAPRRRYRVSAATRGAGRSLSVDLLILDELREQRDTLAWAALSKTTSARTNSLIATISNAGDDESVVLNTIRAAALAPGAISTLGLFEWSAPEGCAIDDIEAWRQANPALGYKLSLDSLRTSLATDTPEVFRTECLCIHVQSLDVLVNAEMWKSCLDPQLSLAPVRQRVGLVFEVAPDSGHASLVAAARFDDGRTGLDVVGSWKDLSEAIKALPALVAKVKPRQFGWFPGGPASEHASTIRKAVAKVPSCTLVEISGAQVTEACMSFVGAVHTAAVRHGDDALLSGHVLGARKVEVSDGYRFTRKGGHVDAAYAAAGAYLLAQSIKITKGTGVWVI